MKHIYFCRHGQSQLNVEGKWAGSTETPLTGEGRAQAEAAGEQAKELHIDYILCSPLSRAHETAEIIAKKIGHPLHELDKNSLVIERHFGPLEGQLWQPDFDMDGIADVETVDSVIERARQAVRHIETLDATTILVVSHSSFGRALRHVLNPDIPFHGSARFQNAHIVKLR